MKVYYSRSKTSPPRDEFTRMCANGERPWTASTNSHEGTTSEETPHTHGIKDLDVQLSCTSGSKWKAVRYRFTIRDSEARYICIFEVAFRLRQYCKAPKPTAQKIRSSYRPLYSIRKLSHSSRLRRLGERRKCALAPYLPLGGWLVPVLSRSFLYRLIALDWPAAEKVSGFQSSFFQYSSMLRLRKCWERSQW